MKISEHKSQSANFASPNHGNSRSNSDKHTLLPAHLTWSVIYDEMHKFVEPGLMVRELARSTKRNML
ncbi:uncharacterized protein PITG_05787 [Phytophthora infestans T30-4]|uniref:Uncharacterized protein n=1 Tax=Phytophthora infestans (strain T30-4) TaxID=403677 RepID=D0N5P3_PHYIT|nr:uncharacterized protein PITG_05787 [Phytophthora infestans T30-4]EEY70384.1 hypothetical protein PITG_05787 [Phytophthora infestans T30-4]|eukprot:XP_002998038.1 hypothetical protein PITG_05787 [Phytophthora infestans T30-4]